MKFVCLGYIAAGKFEGMSEAGRNTLLDDCFVYDDKLRKGGYFKDGQALQPASTAKTLR